MITKKYKFSLLELLIVTVVSLILLGITAPAFLSMSKGQSVDIATRNFGSELIALRNYAITNRQAVALILPTTQENISQDYLYKSYRPCKVNNIHYQYCDFDGWLEDEKWEFLSKGAAILDIDGTEGLPDSVPGDFLLAGSTQGILNVDFSSIGGGTQNSRGIVFTETGITDLRKSEKVITIGVSNLLESSSSTSTNFLNIFINQFTGRVTFENN